MARRMNELEVTAPITGTVTSLVEHVAIGRWVKPSEPLALVEGRGGARIRGLVDAADISAFEPACRPSSFQMTC